MLKKLTSILGEADWDRFHSYAKRVRSLDFDETAAYGSDPETPDLNPTVIAVLSLHHPFGAVLLPHLQKMSWTTDGSAVSMLPFLSGELKELHLEMCTEIPSTASEVFKAIVHRTPNLVTFELEAKVRGSNVGRSLAKWLQTTTNLEDVTLPPNYLTPALIRALGSLPNLRRIKQNIKSSNSRDSPIVLQSLPPGTFPSLIELRFNATLPEAQNFLLASQEVVSRLGRIVLHGSGAIDSENVLNFTHHLAQNCPALAELGLNLCTRPASREQSISPLTMEFLESLYPCMGLESLEVAHPLPFTFQEEDVERMGRAWPLMVSLDICSDPDFSLPLPDQMGNSFSILSAFAKDLPKLEYLGLYFNKQKAPLFTGNLYPEYQFQNLAELHFGLSRVPPGRAHQVGFYIASLCKERPIIDSGRSVWHTGRLPKNWAEMKPVWKEVNQMVGFAMKVKRGGLSSSRLGETAPK